ncbi:Hsp70 family protein [Pseudonocardia sp. HH130630-07]|uniref:Hsp70 family protein n=1 Tax=Pseudonocardia sp. HH130630-07 TaxID=1690815 RepID=UPI000814BDB7|nr:Hsp70 family protein [Pseudonocardia sp. HH130630-07]ANY06832.1 hypothetical protein AFB00_11615 [Pseudonocardia sp. HH130630-07]
MSYLLGIDLGATSVTAAMLHDGVSEVHALPAVLVATPTGDLLCGELAHRRAPADPDRVARGFLDRVGDPTPLSLGGVAYRAEDLCARLVRYLVDEVAERRGEPPARIGVSHPVAWGRHKRDLLAAALDRRGLTVSLVAAPQAVALAHRGEVPGARPLAVVDLGGTGATATVLSPAGAGALPAVAGRSSTCRTGGADVDDAVFAFVRGATPELAAAFDALDTDDPRVLAALAALRDDCRAAKELLSSSTVATVRVALPGIRVPVRLHRSDLDELARPLLEPVVGPIEDALAVAPDADLLLTGGAARMPVAVQVLSAALRRPLAVAADPVHGAARGAALAVSPGPASWPGTRIEPIRDGNGPAPAGRPRGVTGPHAAPGGRSGVALLDASTGPAPSVPAPRRPVAAPPATRASNPAAPAGTRALATAVPAPRAPFPERPVPQTVVTRDAGPAAAPRSRQRILIGAGGLLGAAAVAGALLFWPAQETLGELRAAPTLPATSVPAPAPVAPAADAPADPAPATASGEADERAPRSAASSGGSGGARDTAPAPAAPRPGPAAQPPAPAVVPPPAPVPPASSPAPVEPSVPVTPESPAPTGPEGDQDQGSTTGPTPTAGNTPAPSTSTAPVTPATPASATNTPA